jgi:hypothetical protein
MTNPIAESYRATFRIASIIATIRTLTGIARASRSINFFLR